MEVKTIEIQFKVGLNREITLIWLLRFAIIYYSFNHTNLIFKVLDGHPLSKLIKESIPHLRPKKFDLEGYRKISLNDELNCGRYTFSIGESGGIESLYDKTTNSQLASKQNVLGQFIYTTFSEDNYIQYMDEYGYCPYKLGECDWFILVSLFI